MTSRDYRKSLTWGKRLVAIVLIMLFLFYAGLMIISRSKDTVRLSFEDYLKLTTQQNAQVTDLPVLQLVPDIHIQVKGITIQDKSDPDKTLASADHFYFSAPFWRTFLGFNTFLGFEIKNLKMAAGFFLPAKLDTNIIGITDTRPQRASPMFLVDGTYNNLPLLVTIEMIRRNKGGKALYSLDKNVPLTFKLGELEGAGTIVRSLTATVLKDILVSRGEQNAEFTIDISGSESASSTAKGMINGVNFNAELTKSGEDRLFRISPETSSPENLKKIGTFVEAVKKDLAIDDTNTKFKIMLADPALKETE